MSWASMSRCGGLLESMTVENREYTVRTERIEDGSRKLITVDLSIIYRNLGKEKGKDASF
jgi:hypothetical protein